MLLFFILFLLHEFVVFWQLLFEKEAKIYG